MKIGINATLLLIKGQADGLTKNSLINVINKFRAIGPCTVYWENFALLKFCEFHKFQFVMKIFLVKSYMSIWVWWTA